MSPAVLQQCNETSFSKPAAYITHNATQPLSDITGGSLLDYMQLPLECCITINTRSETPGTKWWSYPLSYSEVNMQLV